jgi:hypothetical protein
MDTLGLPAFAGTIKADPQQALAAALSKHTWPSNPGYVLRDGPRMASVTHQDYTWDAEAVRRRLPRSALARHSRGPPRGRQGVRAHGMSAGARAHGMSAGARARDGSPAARWPGLPCHCHAPATRAADWRPLFGPSPIRLPGARRWSL